jgi:hypothetical protein
VYLLCLYARIQDICYIWYVVAYRKHLYRFIIAYCIYVIHIYTCNLLVQQVIIYVRCGKVRYTYGKQPHTGVLNLQVYVMYRDVVYI